MRVTQYHQLDSISPRANTKALAPTTPTPLAAPVRTTPDPREATCTTATSSYLILYQRLPLEPVPPRRPPVSA